jgi:hypothetical protein
MTERSRARRRADHAAVELDEYAFEPQIDGGQRRDGGREDETGGEGVVGDDGGDAAFPIAEAGIDDLQRRRRPVGGARGIESGDSRPPEVSAHHDGDLRLHRRRDEAAARHLLPVQDHPRCKKISGDRLVDAKLGAGGRGREPDLPADAPLPRAAAQA